MFPEKAYDWGTTRSCIRELAEYGAARKREIGAENVYDFALGNPSVEPPACLKEALLDLISNDTPGLHAYTTAAGRYPLRQKIDRKLPAESSCFCQTSAPCFHASSFPSLYPLQSDPRR